MHYLIACFVSVASALTLQLPHTIIVDESGREVWCGPPVFTTQVDLYEDGTISGLIYQRSQCSSGGRGTKPRYYSACAAATWDSEGALVSTDIIWTSPTQKPGVPARPVGDCIS